MRTFIRFASLVGLCLPFAEFSFADVMVTFPSLTSTVIDSGGNTGAQYCCFWESSRGDSITQTYTGTGLNSVIGLDLSFMVSFNVLAPGNAVDWSVLLNGIQVGTFSWTAAEGTGIDNLAFAFAPISGGGTYSIAMDVTNIVPSGDGSIGIATTGTATLTAVPEPNTAVLLLLTALGILAHKLRAYASARAQ